MCGRYTLTNADESALLDALPFDAFSETRIRLRPRYNVAPGQRSALVWAGEAGAVLGDAEWGFVRPGGGLVINARAETAAQRPMFRDAFRQGRCLVPADGFLEWRREGRINQPHLFRREEGGSFVMAGLRQDDRYVVLTRDATGEVREIHDRMPVVLSAQDASKWLEQGELGDPPALRRTPVSTRINRADHDDPACLQELPQTTLDFD